MRDVTVQEMVLLGAVTDQFLDACGVFSAVEEAIAECDGGDVRRGVVPEWLWMGGSFFAHSKVACISKGGPGLGEPGEGSREPEKGEKRTDSEREDRDVWKCSPLATRYIYDLKESASESLLLGQPEARICAGGPRAH